MGFEKEAAAVKEQAAEREQGIIKSIESLRQETGGTSNPETSISGVLNLPQHETQTSPVIQTIYNPIVNEEGEKGNTDKSSTWKKATDKRRQDKEAKKG